MTHRRKLAALLLLIPLAALGQQKSATLQFLVVKDSNGKPVKNAEIVLHPIDQRGRQKSEGIESKTHEDGKSQINGIPYGKVRIQVIAAGYQTYGQDLVINQPSQTITIKLKKPSDQYSIYH
jgi:hypothetical protein